MKENDVEDQEDEKKFVEIPSPGYKKFDAAKDYPLRLESKEMFKHPMTPRKIPDKKSSLKEKSIEKPKSLLAK
jgi:hypothetical protein